MKDPQRSALRLSEPVVVLVFGFLGFVFAHFGIPAIGGAVERTPCADNVTIVNVAGEKEFSLSIPKGSRTLRGYITSEGEKKRVNVTIKVDGNSGSIEWKE